MDYKMVEVNEAIQAGNNVLYDADRVLDYLSDAKLWGIFDVVSSRSFFSSLIKHAKLDDAEKGLDQLKFSLEKFNSELDDVKVYCDVDNIAFDGFIKFFDIFCDDFLVDIYSLSKISDYKRLIENLKQNVTEVINELQTAY